MKRACTFTWNQRLVRLIGSNSAANVLALRFLVLVALGSHGCSGVRFRLGVFSGVSSPISRAELGVFLREAARRRLLRGVLK